MGRHDPDPLPPIEIVGAEPAAGSLQRVTTGPRGPRGPGGRVVAVAGGVVLVLVVSLALGGGDDEPTPGSERAEERDNSAKLPLKQSSTTTRPGSTTTRPSTTTTTIPVGPVLGEPVGAGLLVYGESGWQLVDLDTGQRTSPDLPILNPYTVVALRGGVVTADPDGNREATLYAIGPGGDIGGPIALGRADQVLPAGRPDRLWLLDGGGRMNEGGAFIDARAEVRLVDVHGEVLRSFEVETSFVSHGLEEGVVFDRGGRVYLANEQGVRPIAVGSSMGVIGDDLLVLGCDDDADCAVVRQPVDGRASSLVFDVADVENVGYDSSTAADGRIALTTYGGEAGQSLLLFAADGTPLGTLDGAASPVDGPPRWLPDDLGLIATDRGGVQWIHETHVRWVSTQLLGLRDLSAEVVIVIDW